MFSNAKNPALMLGFSNTNIEDNAAAVLDEWSALSIEERAENPFSPGPMTRNRCKSVTGSAIKKTPAKPVMARAESPVSMPTFEPVPQPAHTNARSSSPVIEDSLPATISAASVTRHTSTSSAMFVAGVVALIAIALGVLMIGSSSGMSSAQLAPAVDSAVIAAPVETFTAGPADVVTEDVVTEAASLEGKGGGAGGEFKVVEELEAQIRELDKTAGESGFLDSLFH